MEIVATQEKSKMNKKKKEKFHVFDWRQCHCW